MNQPLTEAPASPWVCRFAPLIRPGGEVLDLACGQGRHTRWLAGAGYRVEAVDSDAGCLATLTGRPGITTRLADLESAAWPYLGRQFDGIVVTNYLWRPLLPSLISSLADGGVLIYETFMVGNERFGSPRNPAYLLRPGELLDVIRRRLQVVAFEQGEVELPREAMVQRLCATRGLPSGRLP
jgi:SAM-dependent methyltransferase